MADTVYDLFVQQNVTVPAGGVAVISVGPNAPFERWEVTYNQVSNDGTANCRLEVFNTASMVAPVDASYNGRLDTSDTRFELYPDMKLYFRWSGATVGSKCGLTIRGRRIVKGDRGGGQ